MPVTVYAVMVHPDDTTSYLEDIYGNQHTALEEQHKLSEAGFEAEVLAKEVK